MQQTVTKELKTSFIYNCIYIVHVIVVSWFLQCMGYVQHEGGTIPCTVITMRQLSCTDRLTAGLASALERLYYSTYCALAVQHKILYARCCSIA